MTTNVVSLLFFFFLCVSFGGCFNNLDVNLNNEVTCVFPGEAAAPGQTLSAVSTEPQQQISQ